MNSVYHVWNDIFGLFFESEDDARAFVDQQETTAANLINIDRIPVIPASDSEKLQREVDKHIRTSYTITNNPTDSGVITPGM